MTLDKLSSKKTESLTSKLKGIFSTITHTGVVLLPLAVACFVSYHTMLKPNIDACKRKESIVREEENLKQTYTRSLNLFGDIDMNGQISNEERLKFNLDLLEYVKDKGITIRRKRFDGERFRDIFKFVYADPYGFPTDNVVPRSELIKVTRNYQDHLYDLMFDNSEKDTPKEIDTFGFERYKPLLEKDLF